ncbi:hypothetical protein BDV06DRAFT_196213 [Aspergillus oleicola]
MRFKMPNAGARPRTETADDRHPKRRREMSNESDDSNDDGGDCHYNGQIDPLNGKQSQLRDPRLIRKRLEQAAVPKPGVSASATTPTEQQKKISTLGTGSSTAALMRPTTLHVERSISQGTSNTSHRHTTPLQDTTATTRTPIPAESASALQTPTHYTPNPRGQGEACLSLSTYNPNGNFPVPKPNTAPLPNSVIPNGNNESDNENENSPLSRLGLFSEALDSLLLGLSTRQCVDGILKLASQARRNLEDHASENSLLKEEQIQLKEQIENYKAAERNMQERLEEKDKQLERLKSESEKLTALKEAVEKTFGKIPC